ncbi:MAG: TPM domain-containing protein [Planctomycetota bacterium]|nr:TPM domain-containing protein [Planctomycetota bacterium]
MILKLLSNQHMLGSSTFPASEESGWSSGDESIFHLFSAGAPWLLLAGLLYFVLRAIARNGRYNAITSFDEAQRESVREAVVLAEKRTVGEIVPVVLERSDEHPQANWIAALLTGVLGSAFLFNWLPWETPLLLLLSQLGMGATGLVLARLLPDFKRLFVSDLRAQSVADEQAFQEFYRLGLHNTDEQTGVLLFVSLFEHRVIVLGDKGIDAKVAPELWQSVDRAILKGAKEGDLAQGLVNGIALCADVLEEHFPWREGDRNELPDRVIVRAE